MASEHHSDLYPTTSASSSTSPTLTTAVWFPGSEVTPSSVPMVIIPDRNKLRQPNDTSLVQIGFSYGLNYPFVVSTPEAVAQIFQYLPSGIANGLGMNVSNVTMPYLQPLNTLQSLGFIVTLGMAYIPNDKVIMLSEALLNRSSLLYNHPVAIVNTLMSMVDSDIPLPGTYRRGDEGDTFQIGSSNFGSNRALPSYGVAIAVVGAVALCSVLGTLVRWHRRRLAKRRPTTNGTVKLSFDSSPTSKDFSSKAELPANTWNVSRAQSLCIGKGKLIERSELLTSANRHELDGPQMSILRYELETNPVSNKRSELGPFNMHTERSELGLSRANSLSLKFDI